MDVLGFRCPDKIVRTHRPGRSPGKNYRALTPYRDSSSGELQPSPRFDRPSYLGRTEFQREQDDDAQCWNCVQPDTRNPRWRF